MTTGKFYRYTSILALISLFGFLSYNVMEPFLPAIAWAVVLGIVFYPLFAFISKYTKWKSAAAALTTLVILFIIIMPSFYISRQLANEVTHLIQYTEFTQLLDFSQYPVINRAINRPVNWLTGQMRNMGIAVDYRALITENISEIGKNIIPKLTYGVKNIIDMASTFALMMFTLFFILVDGPAFVEKIRIMLPFSEGQKDRLVKDIKDMVVTAIYGGLAVGLAQGMVSGVIFYLLDLWSPVLLGALTGLMSFVPLMGAVSVWATVDAVLFLTGSYKEAVILLILGATVISTIDNILRPVIVKGRTNVPILIVFFTIIGGINFFGFIGIVLGPLVFVLFILLIDIFMTFEETAGIIGGLNDEAWKYGK
ncbi:AI-2E family transporter [Candidatus Magnetominusculus xianensis]|uniref:Membrane protein n=1 Tax=Candidatus Magnetominusculus xianensis TaxID=1748249 RepID=A0ABR5SFQ8_9BACT|nr:AI-2E family transporter [Candidatus Magnetominusculus xianensis]KWT86776.1 putative membrane protein [Candidatus Magnetominusculus xianensis]MBF0402506.1 AI-2E family transporter [Nitrospirota bacterium]